MLFRSNSASSSDLTVTKTNDASGGVTAVGAPWTWTLHVANSGPSAAAFTSGQVILSDNLPNATVSYGAVSVANPVNRRIFLYPQLRFFVFEPVGLALSAQAGAERRPR